MYRDDIQIATVLLLGIVSVASGLKYVEIFRDDFNDNQIDNSKWNRVTVASTVNEELEHYVADETWQEKGSLYLRSQKRDYGGRHYTSGRVDTRGKFSFKYGEVEWRAKLPKGKGIWPALWLLGVQCPAATSCPGKFWPPEIDVMEARGDQTNKITATLHYGHYPNNAYDSKAVVGGTDYTADFHTYKVIWDPNQVTFFVDGTEVNKITDKNKIPDTDLYLIMNVAVGGWYSGNPDNTTPFPTHFVIDYVSVHRWQ